MGIKETDLPMRPYTEVKWNCYIPGCKGGAKIRDYGILPFLFDFRKRRRRKSKIGLILWRGGWFDISAHYYLCGKHSEMVPVTITPEFMLSKISKIKESKR